MHDNVGPSLPVIAGPKKDKDEIIPSIRVQQVSMI